MAKLLTELDGCANRKARFRTVIAFVDQYGNHSFFEGIVTGEISKQKHGDQGFGYDPIFIPEKSQLSFAQMSSDQKNEMSHRARALAKFLRFLQAQKS
jgi:XTP/dITP diphosphohydrolase